MVAQTRRQFDDLNFRPGVIQHKFGAFNRKHYDGSYCRIFHCFRFNQGRVLMEDKKMLRGIYFINVGVLADKLKSDEISEVDKIKHFIAYNILFFSGVMLPISISMEPVTIGTWSYITISFVILAVIHYYGIWYTYQINKKGDGNNYFERLVCLALPVAIRLTIYLFLAALFFGLLIVVMGNLFLEAIPYLMGDIAYLIASCIYLILFYKYVGKYMRVCASKPR